MKPKIPPPPKNYPVYEHWQMDDVHVLLHEDHARKAEEVSGLALCCKIKAETWGEAMKMCVQHLPGKT